MIPKPNFFIVGAPKTGTTAMAEYLKMHPDIYVPKEKEPHYFSTDLITRISHDESKYLALFENAREETCRGEASVWYLYSERTPTAIKAFNPSAKIIIMLRNPVDMLYSLHSQFMFTGNETIADFSDALAAEPERRAGNRIPSLANFPRGLFYSEWPRLGPCVQRYFDVFGREDVLVILFDEFVVETAKQFRRTLSFLGVDTEFAPLEFQRVNTNKISRSRVLLWGTNLIARAGAQVCRRVLDEPLGIGLVSKLRQLNTRHQPRTPLCAAVRVRLLERFRRDIDELADVLDRDLSMWL